MESPKKLLLRCRLCTRRKDIKRTNIFEKRVPTGSINFLTKIYECTSIMITQTDHLSSLVCRKCYRKINEIYKFRKICLETQQWFNEQLTNIKSESIGNQHAVIDPLEIVKIQLKPEQLENMLDEKPGASLNKGEKLGICNDSVEIEGEQSEDAESESSNLDETSGASEGEDAISNYSDEQDQKITVKRERKKRLKDEEPKLNETVEHEQEEKRRKIYKKNHVSCDVCGKMIQKCRLKQHLTEHLGVQPYACEVEGCGKTYALKKSMYDHTRQHRDPRFICQVCGRRYKTIHRMKVHQRTHTGERPYSCPECPKTFAKPYNLKTHLRAHTKEKPFACAQCGSAYGYRQLLKAHMEKCHVDNRAVSQQINCAGEVQH